MEEHVEKTSIVVDRAESDLNSLTQAREPSYPALEPQLAKLREACQDLFFQSLEAAATKNVEGRLWIGHQKVNNAFRSYLGSLRREDQRRKTVERRKAEKIYLDFIKASQRFYRGFIQRICSHFSNLGELYSISQKMHLDSLSIDTPVNVTLAQKQQLLRSCHMALINCGDLSRYREIELSNKDRNWGPAKGYYQCAADLDPTSGHSFNQLSVMALADSDHFRALYYIYRCLGTTNPFPSAANNLGTELKKIRSKPIMPATIETKLGSSEVPFLLFHARCYGRDEHWNSAADLVALIEGLCGTIQHQPCNTSIRRLCFINIAASYQARKAIQAPAADRIMTAEDLAIAWELFQMLNVATFTMLVKLLSEQLDLLMTDDGEVQELAERLTPIARRLLPPLRIYSAWLISDLDVLCRYEASDASKQLGLDKLWLAYTTCLNKIMSASPVLKLPDVANLLEEDEEMLHFMPVAPVVSELYLRSSSGAVKPHRAPVGSVEHPERARPEQEMLNRLKGLVMVGIKLFRRRNEFGTNPLPLHFGGGHFNYDPNEASLLSLDARPAFADGYDRHRQADQTVSTATDGLVGLTGVDGHASGQDVMQDMVDDLVGADHQRSKSISRPNSSSSPRFSVGFSKENKRPNALPINAADIVQQMSQHNSPRGSFSTPMQPQTHRGSVGLYQTPFAPLPGELSRSGSNSRPSTSHQTASPRLGNFGSSAMFNDELARRQHALENRSSPMASMETPTMSPLSTNPLGYSAFARQGSQPSLLEHYQSPLASSGLNDDMEKKAPAAPRFGAIGDSRPKSARTPTSGQPS